MKQNEVILAFCVWNFDDISVEEMTNLIGIEPTKVFVKGQRKGPQFPSLHNNNAWFLESPLGKYVSFEDQMTDLLDILEPKADTLMQIANKYLCEFSCALFVYQGNNESTPSVHLDGRYNKFVGTVNVEFDIDLYC